MISSLNSSTRVAVASRRASVKRAARLQCSAFFNLNSIFKGSSMATKAEDLAAKKQEVCCWELDAGVARGQSGRETIGSAPFLCDEWGGVAAMSAGDVTAPTQQPIPQPILHTTQATPPPPSTKPPHQQLLDYVKPLARGLTATPEQKEEVDALASALEKLNPTRKPLASPLLNGRWRLEYTTSDSILGTKKPAFLRPSGPIYQFLGESHWMMDGYRGARWVFEGGGGGLRVQSSGVSPGLPTLP